jgi:hypothetical protein
VKAKTKRKKRKPVLTAEALAQSILNLPKSFRDSEFIIQMMILDQVSDAEMAGSILQYFGWSAHYRAYQTEDVVRLTAKTVRDARKLIRKGLGKAEMTAIRRKEQDRKKATATAPAKFKDLRLGN